ncbi:MAG TPA: VOC family protein [Pyrinomonadaceae bacterium]|jgi:predicted enzyme related to lactoylglutathione lyase|nr:VOC family protein [Pyrinomonadaceae bacterium]
MKIALTSVSVNDPLEAFEFYTEKLGFVEKMYMPEMRLAIVVSPEDKDGTALLLEPNGNLGTKEYFKGIYDAGLPVIVFGTDDIQADFDRLKAKGVKFTQEPTKTEWGTQAVFDDTCGNLIQIHQAC